MNAEALIVKTGVLVTSTVTTMLEAAEAAASGEDATNSSMEQWVRLRLGTPTIAHKLSF